MALIVQKYGGTSVADAERIRNVARRIIRTREAGHEVVVVVSARGDTTDELYRLAYEISPDPPKRELDMLVATGEQESIALVAMAIHAAGYDAVSFNAAQVGIYTDDVHQKASIKRISPHRIQRELAQGRIVIVAGFQGIDADDNITTLGRGGSNTSAVAIAAVLKADVCENYTDVDGVYTTDPRIVPEARKLDTISYDEMLELASLGAQVLQSRSLEFAKKYRVPIHVRSSFSDAPGTIICEEVQEMEEVVVRGVAIAKDEAKITLQGVPDVPGVAAKICTAMARRNIIIDMIIQNATLTGKTDFTFTVLETDFNDALEAVEELKEKLGAADVISDKSIAKVSVVGVGMRSHTGVAETMFTALAEAGINIQMISTSEIKISVVVDESSGEEAVRVIHKAFRLHEVGK
ncbi:MAG TPA: aspartate kinase [Planctomycetota bacterium]|nr:aspartate kinase [Planctomycetota bacterium]HUV38114.1 aspartate kinase [Planctomycetota bacterium]